MNWGNRLVLVFVCFALFIGFLVYKCFNTKFDLVSKDYYKDELRYQDKIDGKKNADAISEMKLEQNADFVTVIFPTEMKGLAVNGEVFFYCPTNENNDKHFPITIDADGKQKIDKKGLSKVGYIIKTTWTISDKKFYSEKEIKIY